MNATFLFVYFDTTQFIPPTTRCIFPIQNFGCVAEACWESGHCSVQYSLQTIIVGLEVAFSWVENFSPAWVLGYFSSL